jgi:hypothetical protein
MTDKVNGFVATPDQFLVGSMNMFTVTVTQDIKALTPVAGGTAKNDLLNTLIETISIKAQPVIMGAVAGTGPYTLRFAVEHKDAIVAATLQAALIAAGFTGATVADFAF